MNNYLKQYWVANDDSILVQYELSLQEAGELKSMAIRRDNKEHPYYQLRDGRVLLAHEEGGVLFENWDDLEKYWAVGVRGCTPYALCNPNGNDFLANRYKYIKLLIERLALDPARMDYSDESLKYLSDYLNDHYKFRRQEIEKHLLGFLAYCGETYIKQIHGKWYLAGPARKTPNTFPGYWAILSPDIDFTPEGEPSPEMAFPAGRIEAEHLQTKYYWYPRIELPSGKIKDVFQYFYEALTECALPEIVLQTQTTFEEESKEDHPPFVSPGDPSPVTWGIHVIPVNQTDIDVILVNNPHVRLEEATLPTDQIVYRLEDGKILAVTENHTDGKLFDSETYFYQDLSKAE